MDAEGLVGDREGTIEGARANAYVVARGRSLVDRVLDRGARRGAAIARVGTTDHDISGGGVSARNTDDEHCHDGNQCNGD